MLLKRGEDPTKKISRDDIPNFLYEISDSPTDPYTSHMSSLLLKIKLSKKVSANKATLGHAIIKLLKNKGEGKSSRDPAE